MKNHALGASLVLLLAVIAKPAKACSTFFVAGGNGAIGANGAVVGKNLDWFSGHGQLLINKRNIAKQAVLIDSHNPLNWVSKYASVTFTGSARDFAWEGMNEAGFSVDSLQLVSSVGPPLNTGLPTVGYVQLIQYLVDTSANISEAITNVRALRVGSTTTLHYFICDATSACATLEFINGVLTVHTGAALPYKALTNDTYSASLEYLGRVLQTSTKDAILGDLNPGSLHRFSRAALWSTDYAAGVGSAIDYTFRALDNLTQVVSPTENSLGWRTFWNIAFDLKSRSVSWRTLDSRDVKTLSLSAFDPGCASGTKMLDVNVAAAGDVNGLVQQYTDEANRASIQFWSVLPNVMASPQLIQALEEYPAMRTRCLE